MDGVIVTPGRERGEDQKAADAPKPGVDPLRGRERAVGAVVEDDEGANQEPGGWDRQGEYGQGRNRRQAEHQRREREIRAERCDEVDEATSQPRTREFGDDGGGGGGLHFQVVSQAAAVASNGSR